MFTTQESVFKFNPFPMIYDHYEINLEDFPLRSYIGGTPLMSIMYKNFKLSRLCIFIQPMNKYDYGMLRNLGMEVNEGESLGFKIGMLNIVIIQEDIEDYARSFFMLARCYMNIHLQEIKSEEFNQLSKKEFLLFVDYINEFLHQLKFKKTIIIDQRLVDIKKIYEWIGKILPKDSVCNGLVLYKGTAYKIESFLKVTDYISLCHKNRSALERVISAEL